MFQVTKPIYRCVLPLDVLPPKWLRKSHFPPAPPKMLKVLLLSALIHWSGVRCDGVDVLHMGNSPYYEYLGPLNMRNQGGFQSIDLLSEKTSCEIEALSPILPLCIEKGISSLDPELRRKIAVKLSLCEFRISHIAYPNICDIINSEYEMDLCIESLERHSQHWTTFSGNYREVQAICHQQALPYEKHQIVDLFQNITRLYRDFHSEMNSSTSSSNEAVASMRARFQSMLDTLASIHEQQQQFQQQQSTRHASQNLDLDEMWNKTVNLFEHQHKAHKDSFAVTHRDMDNTKEMLFDLQNNIDASTDGVGILQSKISQLLSAWDIEAEEVLSQLDEMSSFLKTAIIDGATEVDQLNSKIHESREMAISNNQILDATNSDLIQHRISVVEELDCILHEFSIAANSHLKDLLHENELEVKRFVDATMSNITEAFQKTRNMVNQHGHLIEQLTLKFANTTKAITSAVRKVTTTAPIMALRCMTVSIRSIWNRFFAMITVAQYGFKMALIIVIMASAWTMTRSTAIKSSVRRTVATTILLTIHMAMILSVIGGIGAAYAVVSFIESWDEAI